MLSTRDICAKFGTAQEYDVFCKEWAKACYKLNPSEQNRERLEQSKKSPAEIAAEKERESNGDIHESDKG